MSQHVLPPARPADPPMEVQIADLAARYRASRGLGMKTLQMIGGQAEDALQRLPAPIRTKMNEATLNALSFACDTAAVSRGRLPDTGHWLTRAVAIGTGAAGGAGGLPSALAELPVTTTFLLRAIQGIAAEHGFDPDDPDTRSECLQVFAAAGPMESDDGTDLSFLTLRASLTGHAVQKVITKIAPRLAVVLGQKLAAQTVPVLGAVTGAAVNYTFTAYYQEVAHISFGLRKLAEETGEDRAALIEAFRQEVERG